MFDCLFAVIAPVSIPFNSYSVQHLNVSDFAAIQVSPAGERRTRKNTRTVQDPSMLIIGKNGLTVKAKNKANTVRTGRVSCDVTFIDHAGNSQTLRLS